MVTDFKPGDIVLYQSGSHYYWLELLESLQKDSFGYHILVNTYHPRDNGYVTKVSGLRYDELKERIIHKYT